MNCDAVSLKYLGCKDIYLLKNAALCDVAPYESS
jgi:hypothetical protein